MGKVDIEMQWVWTWLGEHIQEYGAMILRQTNQTRGWGWWGVVFWVDGEWGGSQEGRRGEMIRIGKAERIGDVVGQGCWTGLCRVEM